MAVILRALNQCLFLPFLYISLLTKDVLLDIQGPCEPAPTHSSSYMSYNAPFKSNTLDWLLSSSQLPYILYNSYIFQLKVKSYLDLSQVKTSLFVSQLTNNDFELFKKDDV